MRSISEFLGRTGHAINPQILPVAILCGLTLAVLALSFATLMRTKSLIRATERRARSDQERAATALILLQENLNSLAGELHEIRLQPPVPVVSTPARLGLNLNKRSQALRMQRRGDPPDQIAAALDIPLQEVDLLIKVHRILISNI